MIHANYFRAGLALLAIAFSATWVSESQAQIVVAPTFQYPVTPYAVPYQYSTPYNSYYYGQPYGYGQTYYPNYRYRNYRYPTVRIYQTPSTSPTWGGGHSSQYFGNPHASQYFPR
ncbi:MAG: hypothetical protein WBD20_14160 [Pirellulaceae bacterium]